MDGNNRIKVFAPATVANVACGFDVLGFAVENPGDEVEITLVDEPGVRLLQITGDGGKLPTDAKENTVGISIMKYLEYLKKTVGVEIVLHKKMPLGSGLGSSAASAVAGIFAVNKLLGEPLSRAELLPFALEGERLACGSAHADNVAPCLYGGFVLIRSYEPLDVIEISTPDDLYCVLVHPDLEVKTKDARNILKAEVSLKDAVIQWGNVGGLIAGLMKSDYELIGRSLQDVVVEPLRSTLIKGFFDVKNAALKAGVLGASISGSGPAIFALSKGEETAVKAGEAMQKAFAAHQVESKLFISKVNPHGPVVIK
jgi:homoserine kinase